MWEEDPALARFAEEVGRGEAADLGRASLLLALFATPALDVEAGLRRLDALAAAAAARRLPPVPTLVSLFGDGGLRGNRESYYDPRNSLLDQVLERRLGIPITLSVVALEVGRRLGIAVEGVSFPGHFLVRVREGEEPVLLDPFNEGAAVGDAELLLRLRAATGRIGALGPAELGPATTPQILARMLHNLKAIYLRAQDFARALAVQARLVVVHPDDPVEIRDRGLIASRTGRLAEAEADLRRYLEYAPGAPDAEAVRRVADHLRARRGPAN